MSNSWRTVYRSANKRVLRRNGGHSSPDNHSDDWGSTSTVVGGGLIFVGLLAGGFTGFGMILAGGAILFKIW